MYGLCKNVLSSDGEGIFVLNAGFNYMPGASCFNFLCAMGKGLRVLHRQNARKSYLCKKKGKVDVMLGFYLQQL